MHIAFDLQHRAPYLCVEWNDHETSARGWVVVYNFVNHFCSGGIRMHPSVTDDEVYRLARAMAYKYKACHSVTTGGCKAGIAYDHRAPDARDVLKRFLIAMAPLMLHGVNLGGDLGVDANVVFQIWDEIGIPTPQTRAMRSDADVIQGTLNHDEMCSMKLDRFLVYDMITGYGVAFGADELWRRKCPRPGDARVMIQGFGCLGASCAHKLMNMGYTITGIADVNGVVACPDGLDVDLLLDRQIVPGEINRASLPESYTQLDNADWLDVDCDILIPAALEDVLRQDNAHRVRARVVIEGANICTTPGADAIFQARKIDVGVDFTVNLGATRYYDSVIFSKIGKDPRQASDDVEETVRGNVRLIHEESEKTGMTPRQCAEEIFAPDTFDTPDIP